MRLLSRFVRRSHHHMNLRCLLLSYFCFFFCLSGLWAQTDKKKVEIINADELLYERDGDKELQRFIGNVHLYHDSTDFYCKKAIYYASENRLKAFDDVKVLMPNGAELICDRLDYDTRTLVVKAYNNVELEHQETLLETDRLTFYRKQNYGKYIEGGKLTDKNDVLTSDQGYYYPDDRMAYFKKDVILVSPKYELFTDTLGYDLKSRKAVFITETRIKSDDGEITTTEGYYDAANDEIHLSERSQVVDEEYTLEGDSLYYDKDNNYGLAQGNVIIRERKGGLVITGDYGRFNRKTDESMITDNALAIQEFDEDTLYVIADTLYSLKERGEDSTATDKKLFKAFNNVSLYMSDMQGRADSMVYRYSDSMIVLYHNPVLWSDESQLTGDTIFIWLRKGKIDSMWVGQEGFLVSKEDTVGFNQIKGKELHANFANNKIRRLHVVGNSESLYFIKEDSAKYQGMNQAICQDMYIYFKDNAAEKIIFKEQPSGKFFPMHEVLQQENKLEGMTWRIEERPEKPDASFVYAGKKEEVLLNPQELLPPGPDPLEEVKEEIKETVQETVAPVKTKAKKNKLGKKGKKTDEESKTSKPKNKKGKLKNK